MHALELWRAFLLGDTLSIRDEKGLRRFSKDAVLRRNEWEPSAL